jgi:alpha-2-macroglobulin
VQGALAMWVLPNTHPTKANNNSMARHYWNSSDVTAAVLANAARITPVAIPNEFEHSATHSYKYQAPVGAQLYVQIDKGIRSFGGYILGNKFARLVTVPPFPAELKILSKGALLPLSGEKKVAVLVRDLPGVKIEIGRVLPNQLQHLVSQADGNFANPQFYGRFGVDNLIERFERKVPLTHLKAGKAHYEAVDMGEYLQANAGEKRGVFLLSVSSYDPAQEPKKSAAVPAYDSFCNGEACAETPPVESSPQMQYLNDKRLVLVTDLGIVLKKSLDGTQDVFVQSIYSGHPVAGAQVEVIAQNGVTLFSQVSDAAGRASFAKLDGLSRERSPLMVMVKTPNDMSFMPLQHADRGLDMSRFDVGGASNARSAEQISAYLFSDRGIYRPGDTFHIGMIVKTANWQSNFAGLPIEVEVLDARGLTIKREKIKLAADGFVELTQVTESTAPTGTYHVNVYLVRDGKTGAQIGSTAIKVQEFQPDTMKVAAHFSSTADALNQGWVHPKDLHALVAVQNLFGTPAEARQVRAQLTLSPAYPAFTGFAEYKFYDPKRAKEGYNETLSALATNAKGEAEFDLQLQKYAQATYRVHLLAQAFEPQGGRSVAAEAAVLVSDMDYLLGYQADGALDFVARGSKRVVSLIALDNQAHKTAVAGLTMQWVERKFVSVLNKQANGSYQYESRKKEVLLKSSPLNLAAAGDKLTLATEQPGNFAYVWRDAQGMELNRVEYAVAGNGNVTRNLERNAELQLTLNKHDYAPGEDIELSITAPYVGAGLITIERDKVYATQWFKSSTPASLQKIKLPKDFEGNGYISVQYIRDPGSDEIFMSPLSYGVVPFSTSLAGRTNPLKLSVPELVKPGAVVKFKLSAAKPTRAVLFAVDEGVLQVARYHAPDPLATFFQKRMLEVQTAQILDLILPEFKKLLAASAPGGDAEAALGKNLNPFKRKQDKPVVYWSGIVELHGEQEFSYTVPDYFNGSLRVMAVAVNEQSVGIAQGKTLVRGDLIIAPNVPLAVTPGDEFEVSVGVANNVLRSGAAAQVALTLQSSAHLQVLGAATQTLKIGEMREASTVFKLKALTGDAAKLGSAALNFSASLGDKQAKRSVSLSVRPASPRYMTFSSGSFTGSAELATQRNLSADYRHVEAAVSALPLVLTSGLASYLANFEHLCTEQLVSQALPAIVLAQRPEFGKDGKAVGSARSWADTLRILRTRQNAEGGFGLWDASMQADEFASVYALHLMLEAHERGLNVPDDMRKSGTAYLQQLAASPSNSLAGLRARSYAAYLLTRQAQITSPLLASLRESLQAQFAPQWRDDLAAAYLAASYQLLKQHSMADELINHSRAQLLKVTQPQRYEHYYDASIHDAQLLYLLLRHFPERAQNLPPSVLTQLIKPIGNGGFNTLSAAYLILALDAYTNVNGAAGLGKLSITALDAAGKKTPLSLPDNLLPRVTFGAEVKRLRFSNDSNLTSYFAVTETGFDKQIPSTELRNGIEILREYVDSKGLPIKSLKVGDEVTVKLKFRATERDYVSNVALIDLLPGGFEAVLNSAVETVSLVDAQAGAGEGEGDADAPEQASYSALSGLNAATSTGQIEHADVREDRVVFYADVNKDVAEISYRIKATNVGTFVIPPAFAESLYERNLQGRSQTGKTLTVLPAQ